MSATHCLVQAVETVTVPFIYQLVGGSISSIDFLVNQNSLLLGNTKCKEILLQYVKFYSGGTLKDSNCVWSSENVYQNWTCQFSACSTNISSSRTELSE